MRKPGLQRQSQQLIEIVYVAFVTQCTNWITIEYIYVKCVCVCVYECVRVCTSVYVHICVYMNA